MLASPLPEAPAHPRELQWDVQPLILRPLSISRLVVIQSFCCGRTPAPPMSQALLLPVTAAGGRTAHAAVVARQMGKPCIVGTKALAVNAADHLSPASLSRNAIGCRSTARRDRFTSNAATLPLTGRTPNWRNRALAPNDLRHSSCELGDGYLNAPPDVSLKTFYGCRSRPELLLVGLIRLLMNCGCILRIARAPAVVLAIHL